MVTSKRRIEGLSEWSFARGVRVELWVEDAVIRAGPETAEETVEDAASTQN